MGNIPKRAIAGVLAVVAVLGIFVILAISAGGGNLSEDRAKTIALNNAGVLEADATFTKVEYKEEDGLSKYDISFYAGGMEYDYEIDAKEGAVLKNEHELMEDDKKDQVSGKIISEEAAKEKAVGHAGLKMEDVKFTEVKVDDDADHYEIEFVADNMKYEYEIGLVDGEVLSAESEEIRTN